LELLWSLELGAWNFCSQPHPQNSAIFAPGCTCLRLVALWRGEIKNFQSGATVAAEVRRRIPFNLALALAPALAPVFLALFGVVWCSLAQFGAEKLLLFLL